ncbi:UNVERIFIED_ORG: formylglycine-generating enzyme required for sulfatase activity [Buttiauxella agrestis ATCC 33320]
MKLLNQKIMLSIVALLSLSACDNNSPATGAKNNAADLNKYIQQIKSELVFVKGGEFLMGDYGEEYGPEHLPYDSQKDSKPLHKVELSDFYISKFKVNNKIYKSYLLFERKKERIINGGAYNKKRWEEKNKTPETPAHVDWEEADGYCRWLAGVTKLPFSLPTEAQWEFAARNRGEYVIAPTNDGTIRVNEGSKSNVASENDSKDYAKKMGTSLGTHSPIPGNLYPPNPLGIYDMAGNGFEWMKDWYDPDYYKSSPVKDPQGPGKPVFKDIDGNFTKVMRSQDYSGIGRGLTVVRQNFDPKSRDYLPTDKTVRCVVNSNKPIK